MILPWVVAVAALVVAVLAWARTRRLAQRLDQLLQMYWELKYQHGELRRDLQQLTGESHQSASAPERPADAFVPLASLKR
jgi:HAMP domain-containing protein